MVQVYNKWSKWLDPNIILFPVELAGRGKRFDTPLISNFEDALEDVYHSIYKELDDGPYAFFGHSLGALLAYELIKKNIAATAQSPVHAFFSGKTAPHIKNDYSGIYNLPDDRFKQEIIKLRGTSKVIVETPDLYRVFAPIIRSDFEVAHSYIYRQIEEKFDFNITVLYGRSDEMTLADDSESWMKYTSKECNFIKVNGGHFFIQEDPEKIVNIILDCCKNIAVNKSKLLLNDENLCRRG